MLTLDEALNDRFAETETGSEEERDILDLMITYESDMRAHNQRERHHLAWFVLACACAIIACLFVGLLGGCAPAPRVPQPPSVHVRTLDEQVAASTMIEVLCVKGDLFDAQDKSLRWGHGSGVVVGDDVVLTAAHVVSCPDGGTAYARINLLPSLRAVAAIDRIDPVQDIARLVLPRGTLRGERPATSAVKQGDPVCTTPAWPARERRCGKVLSVSDDPDGGSVRMSTLVTLGNSGGAAYVDGRLVGLVVTTRFCGASDLVTGQGLCGGGVTPVSASWL